MTTASPTFTITVHCPEWCSESDNPDHRGGHDLGITAGGDIQVTHGGPAWGAFAASGDVDLGVEKFNVWINFDQVALGPLNGSADPELFRRVAADALSAAAWLEAHR